MEKQLFDWKEWDPLDEGAFAFYKVTLKVQIGPYPTGTKFGIANIDYQKGTLEFLSEQGDKIEEFKLKLVVEN